MIDPGGRFLLVLVAGLAVFGFQRLNALQRKRQFERGRKLATKTRRSRSGDFLHWGTLQIPESQATQHFLAIGTTGSGKSLVQRFLMKRALLQIGQKPDQRALILDAKNDSASFLKHIGVTCPVYTFNPFDGRSDYPEPVAWDIAADVTSSARALNLAAGLIPAEKGGNNQYFTDAARLIVSGIIESFIRHSPHDWTFSDLVLASLSMERTRTILSRDLEGQEVLGNFLGDERTGYQVFTTVVSRMAYFRSIAAIWQRTNKRLSLRRWLDDDSVLLLGVNATARAALDAINEILFRVLVEEIDMQENSSTRRSWIWIDEARLSGPLLRGEMLPYLAVKGRSRGACLVLAFQDIEGFREAAGPRIAHEIIAQCSNKALLRMESEESAGWASKLLGQYEVIETMRSDPVHGIRGGTQTEHLARKDAVLASEFYLIPPTSKSNGLTGYFVSPEDGAVQARISPKLLDSVADNDSPEYACKFVSRPEADQTLRLWNVADEERLQLSKRTVKRTLKLKKTANLATSISH